LGAVNLAQVGVDGDENTSNSIDNTLKPRCLAQSRSSLWGRSWHQRHERMARVTGLTVEAKRLEEDEAEEGSDGKGRLTPTFEERFDSWSKAS
jgi:hypothetical protein